MHSRGVGVGNQHAVVFWGELCRVVHIVGQREGKGGRDMCTPFCALNCITPQDKFLLFALVLTASSPDFTCRLLSVALSGTAFGGLGVEAGGVGAPPLTSRDAAALLADLTVSTAMSAALGGRPAQVGAMPACGAIPTVNGGSQVAKETAALGGTGGAMPACATAFL